MNTKDRQGELEDIEKQMRELEQELKILQLKKDTISPSRNQVPLRLSSIKLKHKKARIEYLIDHLKNTGMYLSRDSRNVIINVLEFLSQWSGLDEKYKQDIPTLLELLSQSTKTIIQRKARDQIQEILSVLLGKWTDLVDSIAPENDEERYFEIATGHSLAEEYNRCLFDSLQVVRYQVFPDSRRIHIDGKLNETEFYEELGKFINFDCPKQYIFYAGGFEIPIGETQSTTYGFSGSHLGSLSHLSSLIDPHNENTVGGFFTVGNDNDDDDVFLVTAAHCVSDEDKIDEFNAVDKSWIQRNEEADFSFLCLTPKSTEITDLFFVNHLYMDDDRGLNPNFFEREGISQDESFPFLQDESDG